MSLPWDDPGATGYGRMVGEAQHAEFARQKRASLRRASNSVLGDDSPFISAIIDFADQRGMWLNRDLNVRGGEIWALHAEHERMERVVCVLVRPPDELGQSLEMRSNAEWVAGPKGTYATATERRWFGLTNSSPVEFFAATLDLALEDAKTYRLDELIPIEEFRRRERRWT